VADVPYGVLHSSFFTGATGMTLQALGQQGKDALLLAAYLSANEWANMIGLYELSPSKLTRQLPAIRGKALQKAFEALSQEQYAQYDEVSEFVWVREMARIRLNLALGEAAPSSKRITGAVNLYQRLPLNPFLGPFYDRYRVELGLKHRRIGDRSPTGHPSNGDRSPFHHRSITDRSGTDSLLVPPSTPSGTSTSGSAKQDQRSADQVPVQAAAAPRPSDRYDTPTVETVTTVVSKEIIPLLGAAANFADLKDATASFLAKHGMRADGDTLRKAIESAQFRAAHPSTTH
jgi:hypothetical protein